MTHNHVHFKNVEEKKSSSEIVVNKENDNTFNVQMGILMAEHEYTVSFKIPIATSFNLDKIEKGEIQISNVSLTADDHLGTPFLRDGLHLVRRITAE
ncbi:unnamed protein product [Caenorhabditis bovis]|uniref:Uncharacterized protein n=1 Tax=Caenorhabditis bovis TaxID=2654633 RepID=A0A8S1FCL7_9PELO|nr:unnamed protein product [Caenorhabditis bovis]